MRRLEGRATDSLKRKFKATILQQVEADIVKVAMIKIREKFRSQGLEVKS